MSETNNKKRLIRFILNNPHTILRELTDARKVEQFVEVKVHNDGDVYIMQKRDYGVINFGQYKIDGTIMTLDPKFINERNLSEMYSNLRETFSDILK